MAGRSMEVLGTCPIQTPSHYRKPYWEDPSSKLRVKNLKISSTQLLKAPFLHDWPDFFLAERDVLSKTSPKALKSFNSARSQETIAWLQQKHMMGRFVFLCFSRFARFAPRLLWTAASSGPVGIKSPSIPLRKERIDWTNHLRNIL